METKEEIIKQTHLIKPKRQSTNPPKSTPAKKVRFAFQSYSQSLQK